MSVPEKKNNIYRERASAVIDNFNSTSVNNLARRSEISDSKLIP